MCNVDQCLCIMSCITTPICHSKGQFGTPIRESISLHFNVHITPQVAPQVHI